MSLSERATRGIDNELVEELFELESNKAEEPEDCSFLVSSNFCAFLGDDNSEGAGDWVSLLLPMMTITVDV